MNEYDVKRGHFSNIEGDKLGDVMKEIFGNVKKDGKNMVSSYGALDKLVVGPPTKTKIQIETVMNPKVENDVASETIKRYNDFLLRVTGFTSKERKKRAQK